MTIVEKMIFDYDQKHVAALMALWNSSQSSEHARQVIRDAQELGVVDAFIAALFEEKEK